MAKAVNKVKEYVGREIHLYEFEDSLEKGIQFLQQIKKEYKHAEIYIETGYGYDDDKYLRLYFWRDKTQEEIDEEKFKIAEQRERQIS